MTSSNGNIFRVTGHLCEEFTGQRWNPRPKASDAKLSCFLWCLRLNERLSKQSWGGWFETSSRPLRGHRNVLNKKCRRFKFELLWYRSSEGHGINKRVSFIRITSKILTEQPLQQHNPGINIAFVYISNYVINTLKFSWQQIPFI